MSTEGHGKLEVDKYELQLHLSQAEAANAQGCFKVALSKMKEAKRVSVRSSALQFGVFRYTCWWTGLVFGK